MRRDRLGKFTKSNIPKDKQRCDFGGPFYKDKCRTYITRYFESHHWWLCHKHAMECGFTQKDWEILSSTKIKMPDRETNGRFKKGGNKATKHMGWKGDKVTYSTLHFWLIRNVKKKSYCEYCHRNKNEVSRLTFAYKYHPKPHTKNPKDYLILCPSCHQKKDIRERRKRCVFA